MACLLKAGQRGLSLAEEFHSKRQHTHTHTHTNTHSHSLEPGAALQPRSLVRTEVKAEKEAKKVQVNRFNFSLDEMCWSTEKS